MAKKLIIPKRKVRTNACVYNPNLILNRNIYSRCPTMKYTKDFTFFNPIMKVMLVTSCIIGSLWLFLGTKEAVILGFGMGTLAMIVQFYVLFPAWIAFGRDCKYKEFILFASLAFLGPFALIWALVGEKNEYDYPV